MKLAQIPGHFTRPEWIGAAVWLYRAAMHESPCTHKKILFVYFFTDHHRKRMIPSLALSTSKFAMSHWLACFAYISGRIFGAGIRRTLSWLSGSRFGGIVARDLYHVLESPSDCLLIPGRAMPLASAADSRSFAALNPAVARKFHAHLS